MDLVAPTVLGLAGVVFGLALGGDGAGALYLGLGGFVLAMFLVLMYRGAKEPDGNGMEARGFTNRKFVQMIFVGTVVGILFIAFRLARG
jgi:hypothetical protein